MRLGAANRRPVTIARLVLLTGLAVLTLALPGCSGPLRAEGRFHLRNDGTWIARWQNETASLVDTLLRPTAGGVAIASTTGAESASDELEAAAAEALLGYHSSAGRHSISNLSSEADSEPLFLAWLAREIVGARVPTDGAQIRARLRALADRFKRHSPAAVTAYWYGINLLQQLRLPVPTQLATRVCPAPTDVDSTRFVLTAISIRIGVACRGLAGQASDATKVLQSAPGDIGVIAMSNELAAATLLETSHRRIWLPQTCQLLLTEHQEFWEYRPTFAYFVCSEINAHAVNHLSATRTVLRELDTISRSRGAINSITSYNPLAVLYMTQIVANLGFEPSVISAVRDGASPVRSGPQDEVYAQLLRPTWPDGVAPVAVVRSTDPEVATAYATAVVTRSAHCSSAWRPQKVLAAAMQQGDSAEAYWTSTMIEIALSKCSRQPIAPHVIAALHHWLRTLESQLLMIHGPSSAIRLWRVTEAGCLLTDQSSLNANELRGHLTDYGSAYPLSVDIGQLQAETSLAAMARNGCGAWPR